MRIGYTIAIAAVPFLDLLDREEESLAEQVREASDTSAAMAAIKTSRQRLAHGVDSVVRSLPTVVRSDQNASRAVAYALIGLVDERMLHHPAGGLNRWREQMLEIELYGSGLAGQEVVARARAATHGISGGAGAESDESLLAPLYLAMFRAGFEGSLRGDTSGLSSLVVSLEEAVGAQRSRPVDIATDVRPVRVGFSPMLLASLGLLVWLVSGFGVWHVLSSDSLAESDRMAERIASGLSAPGPLDPLRRSVGPSGLPPSTEQGSGNP